MSIKIEDIKPGDTVTVQTQVDRVDCGDSTVLVKSSFGPAWFPFSNVATHTPAPVKLGIGDTVERAGRQAEVLGVSEKLGLIWVEWHMSGHDVVRSKSGFTLIRKAAPK